MIINSGQRTDIPAFYSEWFMNRIREGFVMVRNPYYAEQVTRYRLDPDVVDVLVFGTKNPQPLLAHIPELKKFRQLWHVTITPYGKDIEPGVPDKHDVIASFRSLAELLGPEVMFWRYDPVFLTAKYTAEYHIHAFETMCRLLSGATHHVIISYLDLYEKTKRNFPEGREVSPADQLTLGRAFAKIAAAYGMTVHACCESAALQSVGIDTDGCMTAELVSSALDLPLNVPPHTPARPACRCLLNNDIGAYNTCRHFCRYCYANFDKATVLRNAADHDPQSPFLIGHEKPGDIVREATQVSWLRQSEQLTLEI